MAKKVEKTSEEILAEKKDYLIKCAEEYRAVVDLMTDKNYEEFKKSVGAVDAEEDVMKAYYDYAQAFKAALVSAFGGEDKIPANLNDLESEFGKFDSAKIENFYDAVHDKREAISAMKTRAFGGSIKSGAFILKLKAELEKLKKGEPVSAVVINRLNEIVHDIRTTINKKSGDVTALIRNLEITISGMESTMTADNTAIIDIQGKVDELSKIDFSSITSDVHDLKSGMSIDRSFIAARNRYLYEALFTEKEVVIDGVKVKKADRLAILLKDVEAAFNAMPSDTKQKIDAAEVMEMMKRQAKQSPKKFQVSMSDGSSMTKGTLITHTSPETIDKSDESTLFVSGITRARASGALLARKIIHNVGVFFTGAAVGTAITLLTLSQLGMFPASEKEKLQPEPTPIVLNIDASEMEGFQKQGELILNNYPSFVFELQKPGDTDYETLHNIAFAENSSAPSASYLNNGELLSWENITESDLNVGQMVVADINKAFEGNYNIYKVIGEDKDAKKEVAYTGKASTYSPASTYQRFLETANEFNKIKNDNKEFSEEYRAFFNKLIEYTTDNDLTTEENADLVNNFVSKITDANEKARAEHLLNAYSNKDDKISNLNKTIEEQNARIDELESKVTELTNQVEGLEKDLEDANLNLATKDALIEKLNQEIDGYKSEIETLKSTITDLNSQIAQKSSEIEGLKDQIEELKNQNADKEAIIESLNSEIESLNSQIAGLVNERDAAIARAEAAEAKLIDQAATIAAQAAKIAELENQAANLLEQLQNANLANAEQQEIVNQYIAICASIIENTYGYTFVEMRQEGSTVLYVFEDDATGKQYTFTQEQLLAYGNGGNTSAPKTNDNGNQDEYERP
ncbi:MAG: hypothetical protein IJ538_04560 [Clostridia bacterium]|nr:hypothetical protein [Clostridia bacterium]